MIRPHPRRLTTARNNRRPSYDSGNQELPPMVECRVRNTMRRMMDINKLTWAQVGRITEPGRYMFKFGWLTITVEDLWVWENYPAAAFTMLKTLGGPLESEEFRLGTFELRTDSNYSE